MGEVQYTASTGDLVGSRKPASGERAELQATTIKTLEQLNMELAPRLARPAVLTAGDEIQALFLEPSAAMDFMRILKDELFASAVPRQDIVFGVGRGQLSTGILAEATSVEHLDGPCFHSARAMLLDAKKRRVWAAFHGFGQPEDQVLSSLFELMGAIRSGWTATQAQYGVSLRVLGKKVDVAREFGVSPSVITESLQASNFNAITGAESAVQELLRTFDRETDQGGTASS